MCQLCSYVSCMLLSASSLPLPPPSPHPLLAHTLINCLDVILCDWQTLKTTALRPRIPFLASPPPLSFPHGMLSLGSPPTPPPPSTRQSLRLTTFRACEGVAGADAPPLTFTESRKWRLRGMTPFQRDSLIHDIYNQSSGKVTYLSETHLITS